MYVYIYIYIYIFMHAFIYIYIKVGVLQGESVLSVSVDVSELPEGMHNLEASLLLTAGLFFQNQLNSHFIR